MLEIIRNSLNSEIENTTSFERYFESYVMKMQDSIIDQELSYMLSHNIVSISLLDRAISEAYRGLGSCDM